MTRAQALQAIKHHEAAAARAPSFKKRRQHELAADLIRKEHGISEPVSFGRDENTGRRIEFQLAEVERLRNFKNGARR